MRKGIEVRLGPGDRERLLAVIGSGNSPQKHVWRARIVLLSADGVGTMAIQWQAGQGKPTIWRWQARFMAEGVDGLLHDATRPSGKPPLSPATMTHDYKRYGTTTPFAALDVLEGRVIGQCIARHRHREFMRFLNKINRETSASWLSAIEGFFAKLTRQRLKRGVFKGIVDLQATINRYLAETNQNPKPFTWTADPDAIIEKVRRGEEALNAFGVAR
jgi:hypothetical protein